MHIHSCVWVFALMLSDYLKGIYVCTYVLYLYIHKYMCMIMLRVVRMYICSHADITANTQNTNKSNKEERKPKKKSTKAIGNVIAIFIVITITSAYFLLPSHWRYSWWYLNALAACSTQWLQHRQQRQQQTSTLHVLNYDGCISALYTWHALRSA